MSRSHVLRIQVSAKALGSSIPGGAVAAPALSHRLLVQAGASRSDAAVALATAGIGSAVILNVLLWCGLVVSVPLRGVNPPYVAAAVVGALVLTVAAVLVVGLMDGDERVERPVRWAAVRVRRDPERAVAATRAAGRRLDDITTNRRLMWRLAGWAAANWLLDAASLWCLLTAFGRAPGIDGLLIAFGVANVLAAVPVSPGGIGIVEWVYLTALVGFGVPLTVATAAVIVYRVTQLLLPIPVGALAYVSLRWGRWSLTPAHRERIRSV